MRVERAADRLALRVEDLAPRIDGHSVPSLTSTSSQGDGLDLLGDRDARRRSRARSSASPTAAAASAGRLLVRDRW